MASGGGRTIILGGGFSSINGMEFLGQSEAKGCSLHKCSRIFNVRETQKPGENYIITGRILRTTTVKETWNLKDLRLIPSVGKLSRHHARVLLVEQENANIADHSSVSSMPKDQQGRLIKNRNGPHHQKRLRRDFPRVRQCNRYSEKRCSIN